MSRFIDTLDGSALDAAGLSIQSFLDLVALAIESSVLCFALAIKLAVDAVAFAFAGFCFAFPTLFETVGLRVLPGVSQALGFALSLLLDFFGAPVASFFGAVAFLVELAFAPIPFAIKLFFDAITTLAQAIRSLRVIVCESGG